MADISGREQDTINSVGELCRIQADERTRDWRGSFCNGLELLGAKQADLQRPGIQVDVLDSTLQIDRIRQTNSIRQIVQRNHRRGLVARVADFEDRARLSD